MNQSEIYKKEIAKEKQRADNLISSMETLKKLFSNLVDIMLSEDDKSMDFEDCLEHYQNIAKQKIDRKVLQQYLLKYNQIREMIQKLKTMEENPKNKVKKGWF
jgi:hypothetical protein